MPDYAILEAINRMTVARHGGNFVAPEILGEPLYPTIADKAALYMFNIVCNHVFSDGNKRTGLEASKLFARLNGYDFATRLVCVKWEDQTIPSP